MGNILNGYIKPDGNIDIIGDFENFVKEKEVAEPNYVTGMFKKTGKIYIKDDEDAVIDFVNEVEEKFRDIQFDAFFFDNVNKIALSVAYNNKVETVKQFDQIDEEKGTLNKIAEFTETVDDECIRKRKEEKENKEE